MMKKVLYGLMVCLLVTMGAGMAVSQEAMTISGTINDDDQLVDESGQVYEIADTDQGVALLENIGKKVTVTGTVEDTADAKTIMVKSFKVLEE